MKLLRLTMMGDDIFFLFAFDALWMAYAIFIYIFFCCFLCLFSKLWLLSTTQLIRLLRMIRDFALIFRKWTDNQLRAHLSVLQLFWSKRYLPSKYDMLFFGSISIIKCTKQSRFAILQLISLKFKYEDIIVHIQYLYDAFCDEIILQLFCVFILSMN